MKPKYFWIACYFAVILIAVAFWWQANQFAFVAPLSAPVIVYSFGKLAGIIGFTLLLLQVPLAARLPMIERVFGQDTLLRLHRLTGTAGMIAIIVHPLFFDTYYLGWLGVPAWWNFFLPHWDWQTLGAATWVLFAIIVALALWTATFKLPYHWWKRIHLLVYIALIGGFLHAVNLGSDMTVGGFVYYWYGLFSLAALCTVYYRVWVPLQVRRKPYVIQQLQPETAGVTSIALTPQVGQRFDYQPGQFLFVKFISNSVTSEWHPFTISSSPTEPTVVITPKQLGDWTKTLPQLKVGDTALLQAPFGRFSYLNLPNQRDLVFIAGGIGITPFRSMLKHMVDTNSTRNVQLLYGNRTEQDIVFKAELEKFAQQNSHITVTNILTNQPNWPGEKGYITSELLQRLVNNITVKEYFVCGPPSMMQKVKVALLNLGVPKQQIHTEEFAFK